MSAAALLLLDEDDYHYTYTYYMSRMDWDYDIGKGMLDYPEPKKSLTKKQGKIIILSAFVLLALYGVIMIGMRGI